MACGLPVITTANTGGGEIISEGTHGFVVPIRSSEAIAQQLELLYRNEELRAEMSRAVLAKAQAELSWESISIDYAACTIAGSLKLSDAILQPRRPAVESRFVTEAAVNGSGHMQPEL
jgi:Glycosyl transferases group 1